MNLKNMTDNRKWLIALILSLFALLTILMLAYFKGIPNEIAYIPYYDKLGHFFLYGIFGYVVHRASNRKSIKNIPLGIAAFIIFTIVEEYAQNFSANRTASILDLVFSLAGILTFYYIDFKFKKAIK